ncbi:DUF3455 domain-containing protein [Amorphoplanes nipponensis]|uniref:DUF3455 domain-containing protein n=1 Tax=Actinoplanes nipponensis TaxID=135950 RepID=A0A919JJN2_9ACTN|nr:DUF3455 domain-containing protein [Actinoplanes nipponensis]GIE52229.1 hypothetical protein Ani05nite_57630 [Actinoplanes nipponensis]
MPRTRTSLRAVTLAAAATVLVGVGAVSYNASAAEVAGGARPHPSATPSVIDPPAGLHRLGAYRVIRGTQTYTCAGGVFTGPSVPEARLAGPGGLLHHFKGPSWQSERDGSLVTASKTAELARPGSIPELLLTVTGHSGPADGLLARAKNIQRLSTTGGVAPAGACTDGTTKAVPYGAVYVFWG